MMKIKVNMLCGFVDMRYTYTYSGEYGRSAPVYNSFSACKCYAFYEYLTNYDYPFGLFVSKFKVNYLKYVLPVILHQSCFIIMLFKIRSRLWKRHKKPFQWT